MKLKPIILAAVLSLSAGGMIYAGHILSGEEVTKTMFNADEPFFTTHTATITSLPFTSLYSESYGGVTSNTLVLPLTSPDVYCELILQAFDGITYNTDGHLFVATTNEPVGMLNWFSIGVAGQKANERLFATEADYPSNPLNVVAFRDLKGIDVYMGEGTEVNLKQRTDYPHTEFGYSYDPVNRVHSYTGNITGRVDPFRFVYNDDYKQGQKLIVDKIVLHYNC